MTFWEHFFLLLLRRPRPALAALYWHLTKRRVRARNRLRVASKDLSFAYQMWIESNERRETRVDGDGACSGGWTKRPTFSVLIYSEAEESAIRRSVRSVERQVYRYWDKLEIGTEPFKTAVFRAGGHFIVPLRAGDVLSEAALFRFAEALQGKPEAALLYGDEDRLTRKGNRCRPWFKPQWNEELFLAQDYLSSAVAIEAGTAREAVSESCSDLGPLLLALSSKTSQIVHVPHILVHVADGRQPSTGRLEAVRHHLASRGATCVPGPFETIKVEWPLPENLPLVTMIVPTKDKVELLRPCVNSLLERTDYKNFEILIVNNSSIEPSTKRYLEEAAANPKIRVLNYDRPFNYSAINNFAVEHALGAYLCLLNNDTEIVQSTWLTELMRYAVRPEIGAVGAKLLYDDGSIQHAGVVVGIGEAAGHAHRHLPAKERGYFAMPHVAQFVSAVTGACLLVEKSKYERVGGLDEHRLAVAFNDVDFCMKLQAAGWRNVYVPHAVLVHHESKSRGSDLAPPHVERYRRELKVLQDRWGTKTYADPLHNPNLDRYSETFVFRV